MLAYNINSYLIDVSINYINLTYNGFIDINMTFLNNQESIKLDSVNINIDNILIDNISPIYTYDKRNIIINHKFEQKEYIIKIIFNNKINNNLYGLYYSQYYKNQSEHILISTQFESKYCRYFIPLFDDPKYKSIFKLRLTGQSDLTYLSNMPIEREEKIDDTNKKIYFYDTPKMSSYLLAIVIGKLNKISGVTKNNVIVNAYNYYDNDDLLIPLQKTIESINFFEEYFTIKYPLPKLDIIPIPNFSSAAMENWGLITFRESSLFINKNTTDYNRYTIIDTINHEIAHQWFGNLVTMKNWNDLWLNESMATYFAHCAMIKLEKQYYPENFIIERYRNALLLDGCESSHPILNKLDSDDADVGEIFDDITYSKGACIMIFLSKYYGSRFRQNIIDYLNKYAYSNTTTEDFINMFSEIKDIFKHLILTKNYPILKINRYEDKIKIKSNKFILNKDEDEQDNYNINYDITYFKNNIKNKFKLSLDSRLDSRLNDINILKTDTFYISPSDNGIMILDYNYKDMSYLPIRLFSLKDVIFIADTQYILFLANRKTVNDVIRLYKYILCNFIQKAYNINYNLIKIIIKNLTDIFKIFKNNNIDIRQINSDIKFIELILENILEENLDKRFYFHEEIIGLLIKILVIEFKNDKIKKICIELFNKYYCEYKVTNKFYLSEHIFTSILNINYKYYDIIEEITNNANNIFIKENSEFSLLTIITIKKKKDKIIEKIIEKINNMLLNTKQQNIPRYIRLLLNNEVLRDITYEFIIKNIDKIKSYPETSIKIFRQIKENFYDDDFNNKLIDLINKHFMNEIKQSDDNVFRQILEKLELNKKLNKNIKSKY